MIIEEKLTVEASAMMVPIMKTIRRPYMSASDDHTSGPTASPRAGIATVQLTCEYDILKPSCRSGKLGTVVVVK